MGLSGMQRRLFGGGEEATRHSAARDGRARPVWPLGIQCTFDYTDVHVCVAGTVAAGLSQLGSGLFRLLQRLLPRQRHLRRRRSCSCSPLRRLVLPLR